MSKNYILVSSGFIIPASNLFTELAKDNSYRESVLGKRNSVAGDKALSDLVDGGGLYSSAACNEAYLAYVNDPACFDNYIRLVELLTEVFKGIDFKEFARIQAKNTYLSGLGFRLLLEVANRNILTTYHQYALATSFFRIAGAGSVSQNELTARQSSIDEIIKTQGTISVVDLFSDLMDNKPALSAFFKYILTDSNRGGSYG